MRHGWRVQLSACAPLVLWIGVIFLLSSPKASMAETSKLIGPILNFFFPNLSEAARQTVHYYVRKTAHFTEYGVLAYLAIRAMLVIGVGWTRLALSAFAVTLVLTIASVDELNQSFEPSRTGSIWDVLLDVSGGLSMVICLWLTRRRM